MAACRKTRQPATWMLLYTKTTPEALPEPSMCRFALMLLHTKTTPEALLTGVVRVDSRTRTDDIQNHNLTL